MLEDEVPPTSTDEHCTDTDCEKASAQLVDLNDPNNWPVHLDDKTVALLVEKGPVTVCNFNYPSNQDKRHFSDDFYVRKLPNGEKAHRDWLVYSKKRDSVFCFCCKLFNNCSSRPRTKLANEGNNDWRHLAAVLKQHETSRDHITSAAKWMETKQRLETMTSIDYAHQREISRERAHWQSVLTRIIAAVQYLSEHNLAFRGTNAKLYEENNGNFLGLIEMVAKFDPAMQEHVRRIRNKETHAHYLGPQIQNEIISIMATNVKNAIVNNTKRAKYFSVLLDCTPDMSHQEQMSLILRFVNMTSLDVTVEEHFIDFIPINDQTGKGLSNALLAELEALGLDINDCRGQGYDNGANMKGQNQGVQAHILRLNPRAYFMPCGCHNLNLTLGDMARCSSKAMSFFGIVQRIYTIFAGSPKRWEILKAKVPSLTVKPLSETRWECRVESVRAIRYQTSDIRDALLEVAEGCSDPKVKSETMSLANEIQSFEFLMSMVIWYDILFAVNTVSKTLQSKDMQLDVALSQLNGLIDFMQKYRDTGFAAAKSTAIQIATDIDIEPVFKAIRRVKCKRDENQNKYTPDPEQAYVTDYFFVIVDQALTALHTRFKQMQEFGNMFGFLFDLTKLCEMDETELERQCTVLNDALSASESQDINAVDFFHELRILREIIPKGVTTALQTLRFIRRIEGTFPNCEIALRILLTIPITVASSERSFSKLKLIKNYLRTTMSQERLCGLALLSIEKDIASKLDYNDFIAEFAAKKARKVTLI